MRQGFEILVVGGGVSGLTMAGLLANGPHAGRLRITLVDASERPAKRDSADTDLRVSAISSGSADLLAGIGAWQALEPDRICAYDHMRVWDAAEPPDGPRTLRFDAEEFAVPHLGYIVENLALRRALLSVLEGCDVSVRFAAPFRDLHARGNRQVVRLGDGTSVAADLVIAADGARSGVRRSAGIDLRQHAYDQSGVVAHVVPANDHRATAWQRFLRDGPIGLLPLADGRVSVVWTMRTREAEQCLELDDADFGARLTRASGGVLGKLGAAGPRAAFPLAAHHANDYVRHGIALVGDAAHAIHPLAGQGANLGLADTRVLADVIMSAIDKGEYPADRPVLRRYERARKAENAGMMHFMTGLNRLFASDSALLGELRRTGMALFNRSGPVRRRVVDVALGNSGA